MCNPPIPFGGNAPVSIAWRSAPSRTTRTSFRYRCVIARTRTRLNDGNANAASTPTITVTIMISTRVKARRFDMGRAKAPPPSYRKLLPAITSPITHNP